MSPTRLQRLRVTVRGVTLGTMLTGLLTACADDLSAPVPGAPIASRSANAAAAVPVLTWLAPLGAGMADSATFDATAVPVVEICAWSGTACTAPIVVRFATTPGPGDQPLTVNRVVGAYEGSWNLMDARFTTRQTYRIRVSQSGTELGALSVDVVRGRWALTRINGTLAPLMAATTLPIRFALARQVRLGVIVGPGVLGSPAAGTTSYPARTRVTYDFRAADGYQNVAVLLDGVPASARGEVTLGTDHVLLAGADRVPTVSAPAEPLVPLAAALLRATDPVSARSAADAFAAGVTRLYQTVGVAEAREQLARVTAATFDPVRDSAAFRRFTQAFEAAGPTALPLRTPVVPGNLRSNMRSGAAAPLAVGQPTSVIFVNGILNSPSGFAESFVEVQSVTAEAAVSAGTTDLTFVPFFNASWWASGGGPAACILALSTGLRSVPSKIASAVACAPAPLGPLEVTTQYFAGLSATPSLPVARAAELAVTIQRERALGRRVLVIAHSQGNLMAQQALRAIEEDGGDGALACIAVTSVAPPVSRNWPAVPRDGLFAQGTRTRDFLLDVLPITPDGDKVRSNVTDAADARVDAFFGWVKSSEFVLSPDAYLTALGAAQIYTLIEDAGLHPVVSSYLYGDGTREFIRGSIATRLQALDAACDDDMPGEPGQLVNGRTYVGRIARAAEVDTWTFTASPGDDLAVGVGTTGTPSANFDVALTLIDPTGRPLVASSSPTAGAGAATVNARATTAGTYTVRVQSYPITLYQTGTGDYRISLVKTGAALVTSSGDEGGPLTNGGTSAGRIYLGDIDGWTFTAGAGDDLAVGVGTTGTPSANFDVALTLIDPTGRPLVASSSPTAGAGAATVNARATTAGTYTVRVQSYPITLYQTGTGDYRISLVKTGAALVTSSGDEGGPLTNGGTSAGRIYLGDIDGWTFTAGAGDDLAVGVGTTGTPSANFDVALTLIDPTGRPLVASSSPTAGAGAATVNARATTAGTYTVRVQSYPITLYQTGTGDYRISLVKTGAALVTSSGDEGGPLTNGGTSAGRIYLGDIDGWTFTAGAGDDLAVGVGTTGTPSANFDVALTLIDPTGRPLVASSSPTAGAGAATVNARATTAGTYTVRVQSYPTSLYQTGTGDYNISLLVAPPALRAVVRSDRTP